MFLSASSILCSGGDSLLKHCIFNENPGGPMNGSPFGL